MYKKRIITKIYVGEEVQKKYVTSFIKRYVYVYMYIKYLKDKQNIDCL